MKYFFVQVDVITAYSALAIIHKGPTEDREDCPCFDGNKPFLHDAYPTYKAAVDITQAPDVTVEVSKCTKCFSKEGESL